MTTESSGEEAAFEGVEWLVDAHGCAPSHLGSIERLEQLFQRIVEEMELSPIGSPAWTQFPDTGGVTGFLLLQESHLACHTFPEYGTLCVNLFCCRRRAQDVDARWFEEMLEAGSVTIRCLVRPLSAAHLATPARRAVPLRARDARVSRPPGQ